MCSTGSEFIDFTVSIGEIITFLALVIGLLIARYLKNRDLKAELQSNVKIVKEIISKLEVLQNPKIEDASGAVRITEIANLKLIRPLSIQVFELAKRRLRFNLIDDLSQVYAELASRRSELEDVLQSLKGVTDNNIINSSGRFQIHHEGFRMSLEKL